MNVLTGSAGVLRGRRVALVALVVVFGVVGGACGSGSSAESTSTVAIPVTEVSTSSSSVATTRESTITTVAATTTVPSTTSTTGATTTVPVPESLSFDWTTRTSWEEFDLSGDDPYQTVLEWYGLFSFYEANPRNSAEEMALSLYAESYTGMDLMLRGFGEIAGTGWRYVSPSLEVVAVGSVDRSADRLVFQVVSRRDEQVIVDSSGAEVKRYRGWELREVQVIFVLDGDDGWRRSDDSTPVPWNGDMSDLIPVEWATR